MSKYLQGLGALARWFERQKRVLPWRSDPSPYRVWVSEIMLQQTQVKTVLPYFDRFISRFPDVHALAQASLEDVYLVWSGLGYYSRARNLHRAAQQLSERVRRTREFPSTREEWESLPGVGPYTAGAVLSIAWDQPEAILDGNIERVLCRLRQIPKDKPKLWKLSEAAVQWAARAGLRPSQINQALMELGALVCTPRKPACLLCPLAELCKARAAGSQENYPPRLKRSYENREEEMVCLQRSDGKVLIEKREQGEWRSGLWDFPRRLPPIRIRKSELNYLGTVETHHVVTRHRILRRTHLYVLKRPFRAAEPGHATGQVLRWIDPREEVPSGSAFRKALSEVLEQLPPANRESERT